jgi:hypothetical protein
MGVETAGVTKTHREVSANLSRADINPNLALSIRAAREH